MLPSDLRLCMGRIKGFNNKLLISTATIPLGLNKDVNVAESLGLRKPKYQEHNQTALLSTS